MFTVHFWNCKKWDLVKKMIREIYLFDFTSFFGLNILKYTWNCMRSVFSIHVTNMWTWRSQKWSATPPNSNGHFDIFSAPYFHLIVICSGSKKEFSVYREKAKYCEIGVILDPVLAALKLWFHEIFVVTKKYDCRWVVQFYEIFASTTIINSFTHYFCNKNFLKLHNWDNIWSGTSPKAVSI